MVKIAFLDTLGLKYDGDTLNHRGLGGSESAVIYISRELAKLGFDITVFNEIENEGIYDNVKYLSKNKCKEIHEDYDVLISLRSCLPFVPDHLRNNILSEYGYDINNTLSLVNHSKHKIVWLHDTFCAGDHYLEHLCLDGYIDELFCLSDWHSNYVMNGHDWRSRYFEVLKNKVWQTRNGIENHIEEIDISKKDKNLFVYNSSITKGMIPLVRCCWDKIKKRIPDAKLVIIGGYYRGANQGEPDENELNYFALKDEYDGINDITFTGIIKQQEIAKILSKASLMIYPGAFPETYGISTLEAINCNVPLVGCRFGALEEVAAEQTSYLINYDIGYDDNQIERFVSIVEKAYYDDYLRQQKAYACNGLKPCIYWDTVALQWKQHLYNQLGLYMDVNELRQVRKINKQVIKYFGRRFNNREDFTESITKPENRMMIISPFYNAGIYINKCIQSVASQDYENYFHILIDDMSDDNSLEIAQKTIDSLPENIKDRFILIKNENKKWALQNQVETIKDLSDNCIVILLDGDDWLANNPDIFNIINNEYNEGAEFTYGSCYSLADRINLIAQPYPKEVHENKSYRKYLFNWGMPYTHLRTFKASLFKKINPDCFLDGNKEFYKAGGDNALFYPLIEACSNYKNIRAITEVLYIYNDLNKLNDYKVNPIEQNKNAEEIRNKKINMFDMNEVNTIKEKIVEAVRDKDPEAISIYKYIASNREDVWVDNISDVYLKPRIEWLTNKIDQVAPNKNIKILDIGSWTGSISNCLYEYGYKDIVCVDISRAVVEMGKQKYPHLKWVLTDIEEKDITEKYDVVLACEVLEHLVDPYETIDYIRNNLLTENGILIYTIPEENYVFGDRLENIASEHISKITKNDLNNLSDDIENLQSRIENNIYYEWYVGTIKKPNKKSILIALPTAKYIESETFKSIYYLTKPNDYTVDMECFYGYRIDQIRNLICYYAIENKYDYVFFVDSDIVLPSDTLIKLLSINKPIATGIYIQRKKEIIPEIYINENGNIINENYKNLVEHKQIQIAGCGFGCVLVNIKVIKAVGYPQFEYHSAIKMEDTYSEDLDFCTKAINLGFDIYADTSIKCDHIGETRYNFPVFNR